MTTANPEPRAGSTQTLPRIETAIQVSGLQKRYGAVEAVRGINLEVERARFSV